MLTRRDLVAAGGLALAGLAVLARAGEPAGLRAVARGRPPAPAPRAGPAAVAAAPARQVVEIAMRSDPLGAEVWFDPIGLYLEPGQTVRWVVMQNVHTTTAYHPANDRHSLRIPEEAAPWDSGFLVNPGDRFEVTLTVEGVYDYYCAPHETAGMVGRLVVGRPAGPGALPFDYFAGRPGTEGWKPVPAAARRAFPSVERILREKVVRRG